MGSCLSRLKLSSFYYNSNRHHGSESNQISSTQLIECDHSSNISDKWIKFSNDVSQHDINNCLIEAEKLFLSVVDIVNLPSELRRLIEISSSDCGWLKIIKSMIDVVGLHSTSEALENDYIGPTIILLLLEDSPLPTRELLKKLLILLDPYLTLRIHSPCDENVIKQRNVCTILSFLAEKLAGTLSINFLSIKVLKFLEKSIKENLNYLLILFALSCIEKFALTKENKELILKNFDIVKELCEFEKYAVQITITDLYNASLVNILKYQVGFCSQWCLDNVFFKRGRKLSYKKVDYSNLNCILNVNDKTDFLKLAPNGLSARCDTSTFESVRSTFSASSGSYFYEVLILTSGIMQLGWATKSTIFKNHEGSGVGDDLFSIAFDGCRNVIWHNSNHYKHNLNRWNSGDVVGCLIDLDCKKFIFYLNGKKLEINRKISKKLNLTFFSEPYFAAASLMSYQQCYFNFGQSLFRFPPKNYNFKSFCSESTIADKDEFKVIPMHVKIKSYKTSSFIGKKNLCNICFDKSSNVRLKPCDHETICDHCASLIDDQCPFCRKKFTHFEKS